MSINYNNCKTNATRMFKFLNEQAYMEDELSKIDDRNTWKMQNF